jgi:hypothetical protein
MDKLRRQVVSRRMGGEKGGMNGQEQGERLQCRSKCIAGNQTWLYCLPQSKIKMYSFY